MLVELGYFLEVQISFLVPGHTYEDIDRFFGAVKDRMRYLEADSPPDLFERLGSLAAYPPHLLRLYELQHIYDYRHALHALQACSVNGLRAPLCFYIKRHGGPNQPVSLKFREYASIQVDEERWHTDAAGQQPTGFALLDPECNLQAPPALRPIAPTVLSGLQHAAVARAGRMTREALLASPWWRNVSAPANIKQIEDLFFGLKNYVEFFT